LDSNRQNGSIFDVIIISYLQNIPLYLNLSQCYLNESEFRNANDTANEVLKRDPDNEKALFRRVKAEIGMCELDSVRDILQILIRFRQRMIWIN
jgi:hypothetical protein